MQSLGSRTVKHARLRASRDGGAGSWYKARRRRTAYMGRRVRLVLVIALAAVAATLSHAQGPATPAGAPGGGRRGFRRRRGQRRRGARGAGGVVRTGTSRRSPPRTASRRRAAA